MTDDAPSRVLEKFVVRLPPGMREQIAQVAEKSGRSMNAEIVHRLRESLDSRDVTTRGSALDAPHSPLPSILAVEQFAKQVADAQRAMDQFAAYSQQATELGKRVREHEEQIARLAALQGQPRKPKGK